MAGRHGKMSGSPFHVITTRDLASEQYGDQYTGQNFICKYRQSNTLCKLPQNKNGYGKKCNGHCKYISCKKNITRNSCALLINDKCYHQTLSNCTQSEDLAYCCEYYLPLDSNKQLHERLLRNSQYFTLFAELPNCAHSLLKKRRFFLNAVKKSEVLRNTSPYVKFIRKVDKIDFDVIRNIKFEDIHKIKDKQTRNEAICVAITQLKEVRNIFEQFLMVIYDYQSWLSLDKSIDIKKVEEGYKQYCEISNKFISIINESYR